MAKLPFCVHLYIIDNTLCSNGVKWEDTLKKEENEDIFLEKEDKRRTFFSKINTKEAKKVHVNYSIFL